MDAPLYELTYFNSRGSAEIIRLLFAQAGVDYIDIRITKEEWLETKYDYPFGQLPILKIDDTVVAGSRAIARYVANQFGLVCRNNLDAAKCDMLVDAFYDLYGKLEVYFMEEDKDKKIAFLKKFLDNAVPPFMQYINYVLQSNNEGAGFFVGRTLTWADIALGHGLHSINELAYKQNRQIFKGYYLLQSHSHRMVERPRMKAWMEQRPVTED